ncbi:MAG TPA: type IV toxin-antitoxin system AbiEi family antitoxin domain-containing protein [Marmoricola sp.]|nr:type IV toxin-antitoxin system AbiEi family antitoxin domain-containing protein [Marmoricola sp.]
MTTALAVLRTITARHGSFQRREALEVGFNDASLRRGVRRGVLVRVRHGAYAFADDWVGLDDVDRHLVLAGAVLRSLGPVVAASHHTGSLLHGLELWDADLSRVHVTRLDGGAGRTERDVVHHEGVSLDTDVVQVGNHLVVRPVRAALESALITGVEQGLVVVESGLRKARFTLDQLAAQHALMRFWPAAAHLQLVTRLADVRSESVGESRSMNLFWAQGLPRPQQQFEVYDAGGRLVGTTDFAWPEHGLLGEFDGKAKYLRYLRPGEEPGDAVFREKQREDRLRRVTGWSMVRLTWADLYDPARTAAYVRSLMRKAA